MFPRRYHLESHSKNIGGNIMRKLAYLLSCVGITYKEYCSIVQHVKCVSDIKDNEKIIRKYISDQKWNTIMSKLVCLDNDFENMKNLGLNILTIEDEFYPESLKNIFDPPYILYYIGDVKLLKKFCISVVGSRKPTPYGIFAATKFSKELVENGIVVVSGLAIGIDTCAQKSAVENGGKTIGILGTAFDNIYPKSNTKFIKNIVSSGNLVLSEYPLNKKTMPYHFVQRNRLISGIGEGILVIEAGEKSGTLTTVDFALEQGKTVFSIPGNIDSRNSFGTNNLIKTGAKLVMDIDDILNEYPNFNFSCKKIEASKYELSETEKLIFDFLKFKGVQNIETIAFFTNTKIKDIIGILNILVIKGVVKELGNGMYSL